jgi:hypothetical protein
MRFISLFLMFSFSPFAFSCPETLDYGSPCPAYRLDYSKRGQALDNEQEEGGCVTGWLSDGVCADYLQGGCAQTLSCDLVADELRKADKPNK